MDIIDYNKHVILYPGVAHLIELLARTCIPNLFYIIFTPTRLYSLNVASNYSSPQIFYYADKVTHSEWEKRVDK